MESSVLHENVYVSRRRLGYRDVPGRRIVLGAGLFWAPFVGLVVLAASLAPVLKKASPDGVTAPGNALGPFKPEAELTNGRGAMGGLVALVLAEKFTNGSPLF